MTPTKTCPRGHQLLGYNSLYNGLSSAGCRACKAAFQWARGHRLFNDNPAVVAHADQLYAGYVAAGGVS